MIIWRRRGYTFRLEYFRSITNKKDDEFKLGLRDMILSEPAWNPNPAMYERDHFCRIKIHNISPGNYI